MKKFKHLNKFFIVLFVFVSVFACSLSVFAFSGYYNEQNPVDTTNYFTSGDNVSLISFNYNNNVYYTDSVVRFPKVQDLTELDTQYSIQIIDANGNQDLNYNIGLYTNKSMIIADYPDIEVWYPFVDTYVYNDSRDYGANFTEFRCDYSGQILPISKDYYTFFYFNYIPHGDEIEVEYTINIKGLYPINTGDDFILTPFSIENLVIYKYYDSNAFGGDGFDISLYYVIDYLYNNSNYVNYFHNGFLYITSASFTCSAVNMSTPNVSLIPSSFSIFYKRIVNTNRLSYNDYNLTSPFDISPFGVSLFNAVTNFFSFELVPGFSLLDLLLLLVGIPLLLSILKLFLGG